MLKLLKFIGFLLKACCWLLLMLVLAGLVGLYILERNIPEPLVRRLCTVLSNDDMLVRIDRATFSLTSGLRLHRVKALPKRIADTALVAVDEIAIDVSLLPKVPLNERVRGVTLKNVSMPALPPKRDDQPKKPDPAIPLIPPFPVTIENADVLGIRVSHVDAMASLTPKRISLCDVTARWPNSALAMKVTGSAALDFSTRLVTSTIKGQAYPENIVPMLEIIDTPTVVREIGYFSKLQRPVEATMDLSVNIDNADFRLLLGLGVGPCLYHGVPMKFAKGPLSVYGTNSFVKLVVGPLDAESSTGKLHGGLTYESAGEKLSYDASSDMDMTQIFNIIDILNKGELDRITCHTYPRIASKGVVAAMPNRSTVTNALGGTASLGEGTILNFHLKDISTEFTVDGYTARFENMTCLSASGGKIRGDVVFHFPNYAATSSVFSTNLKLEGVDLAEVSQAFNVTNARAGLLTGEIHLQGPTLRQLAVPHMAGGGKVTVQNGVLNRMRLFAGFTDYLAKTIPGISALITQSSGSMDFVIRDGVLSTENLLIEGDVFSITGRGTYNLAADKLDFVLRANIFRQKTLAGKITHFLTMPFTRLLLEFKVFGPLDNPDWSYVNIIEQISDKISELSSPADVKPAAQPEPKP